MDTSSVAQTGSAPAQPSSQGTLSSTALGKEDFLRLLVTQLSNQDPLNPMDGQQFAAQLAQFTTVEQLVNIEDQIAAGTEINSVLAQSMNSSVAAGMIGKHVHASSEAVAWDGSESSTVRFASDAIAAEATVEVINEQGLVIRTETLSRPDFETLRWRWDGKNDEGVSAQAGTYRVAVRAVDANGDPVSVSTGIEGTIERVTFTSQGIQLWISGVDVAMADIMSIEQEQ